MSQPSRPSRRGKLARKILIGIFIAVAAGVILAVILKFIPGLSQANTGPGSATAESPPSSVEPNTSSSPTSSPSTIVPLDVQITFNPLASSDLEVGESYEASGMLAPALPGASIQIKANDTVLTEVAVDSEGGFSTSFQLLTPGRQVELIAYLAAGPGNQEATATAGKYDVYGWTNLSDLKPLSASGNFASDRQQDLKGQQYDHSLVFYWSAGSFGGWSRGDATYNLAAKCIKFTALVGPEDNAPGDNAQWSFTVSAGSRDATSGYIAVFKPKLLEWNLKGAPRLKVEASRKKGPNENRDWKPYQGDGVVADPKILCLP